MAAPKIKESRISLSKDQKLKIISFWDAYENAGFTVQDLKLNQYSASDFDKMRRDSGAVVEQMIQDYLDGKDNLKNFKISLDGYNKRNNLWGFAAMKGQMFFNLLWNSSQANPSKLDSLLKKCIELPDSLPSALEKIDVLEDYILQLNQKVEDRRKAPNKGSVAYFLSYFWQIKDSANYPIFYTSLTDMLEELELWKEFDRQASAYEYFFGVMHEVKFFLEAHTKLKLHHWDVEHCFWKGLTDSGAISPARPGKTSFVDQKSEPEASPSPVSVSRTLAVYDYIPPIIADLVQAGAAPGNSKAIKGTTFERKVGAAFQMLDFEVDQLGQGKGREPDGVITCRQDNIAFIFDAKVREDGYSIGVDDRAIREYIEAHFSRLERQGYKKIGFLLVSSKFNGNPTEIIQELTLETPIKRVALVTSEALLHLLAHKLSSGIGTSEIAKFLLQDGILEATDVDEAFADV